VGQGRQREHHTNQRNSGIADFDRSRNEKKGEGRPYWNGKGGGWWGVGGGGGGGLGGGVGGWGGCWVGWQGFTLFVVVVGGVPGKGGVFGRWGCEKEKRDSFCFNAEKQGRSWQGAGSIKIK